MDFKRLFDTVFNAFQTKKTSPSRRVVHCEPLEERALLAINPMGPFLPPVVLTEVAETVFVASETINVADNEAPYGPFLVDVQSFMTLAYEKTTLSDETVKEFRALWNASDVEEDIWSNTCADVDASPVISQLILDDIGDFNKVDGLENATLLEGSGRSGGSGNGGSGGSGGSGGGGGSGGSTIYVGLSGGTSCYCEGETIYFSLAGGQNGDQVSVSILGGDGNSLLPYCDVNDFDLSRSRLTSTKTNGVWPLIYLVTRNDEVAETNEKIRFGITSGLLQLTNDVTLVERPEFFSDVDAAGENGTWSNSPNSDRYRAYIKRDFVADAPIVLRTNIHASGSSLSYSLVGTSDLFRIDVETGVITLKQDVSYYLVALENNLLGSGNQNIPPWTWTLNIKVEESCFHGEGAGSSFIDMAEVVIDLAEWRVNRNPTFDVAPAIAGNGATVAELALKCGLTAGELKDWLTITGADEVELFDGQTVSCEDLSATDILAGSSRFKVPNTIRLAWFGGIGEHGEKDDMHWTTNQEQLRRLGFNVSIFDNESYAQSLSSFAKNDFLNDTSQLSSRKALHGLYISGNGDTTMIGSTDTNTIGPEWSIDYVNEENSISSTLKYRLGALIIHASDSGQDENGVLSDSRNLVTDVAGRVYFGSNGAYDPEIKEHDPIAKFWNIALRTRVENGRTIEYYRIGGLQHTKEFEVIIRVIE